MMTSKYPIRIDPVPPSQGIPSVIADFGRITVLLGSNGTGKSRALRHIRGMASSFGESNRPIVYIEGGRVITLPERLIHDSGTYSLFGSYAIAKSSYQSRRHLPIIQRHKDSFYLLEQRSNEQKIRHSNAVSAWQLTGCAGACPTIEEDPLKRLFAMFSEVFPEIRVSIETTNKDILAYKNDQRYSVNEMSDGERQVLFILADIALSAEPNSLIIVDEPELNLNPQLAGRLWDTIEGRLADAIFVYATHNVSFALRQSVECVIALSGHGAPAVPIKSINDLAEKDARELLGAIPAIMAAPAAIGVEGNESSFDNSFYAWLLKRKDVAIVPLGGCQDVLAATMRRGFWQELAPSVKLIGIVDRDYRSEATWTGVSESCHILEYHEAESYLCHPDTIVALATKLGTLETIPSQAGIMDRIIKFFSDMMLRIAINRMINRAQVKLNVALEYARFKNVTDLSQLRYMIGREADNEAAKASAIIGSGPTIKIFDEELQRCQYALENRNLDELLRLCPGKELLHQLAPISGCKDSTVLARATYKHLDPLMFKPLVKLSESIHSKLAR